MLLKDLASLYPQIIFHPLKEVKFSNFTRSNEDLDEKTIFVAIEGSSWDGHLAVEEALKICPLVVVERDLPYQSEKILKVDNTKVFFADLANLYYKNPSKDLYSIAITGTNGKTTTAYMVEFLLKEIKRKPALIGTIDHHYLDKVWKTKLTSPGAKELQARLREILDLGADSLVMETSSHAIDQFRIQGMDWDVAVFTNLSQDHLDYHGDMENYFKAKEKLFTHFLMLSKKDRPLAVVNQDDPWGQRLMESYPGEVLSYGKKRADLQFSIIEMDFNNTKVELDYLGKKQRYDFALIGEHNVYNALAASLALHNLGHSPLDTLAFFERPLQVPGRLEKVQSKEGIHIFIDFAHSPEALERTLAFLSDVRKRSDNKGRLICVFGCGGDRDRTKRPLMASASEKYADYTILTNDNPRTEDPKQIAEDTKKGFNKKNYKIVLDRKNAIAHALEEAKAYDIVLIAGKGHEDYQEIGNERKHFSDQEVVREIVGD